MDTTETLYTLGDTIKAVGNGEIEGYLVRYTDEATPDTDGYFFTKSTDYDIEDGDKVSVYYQHGFDPVLKTRRLGRGTMKQDDFGVWVKAQLDMRDKYEKWIYSQCKAGRMGWSSATLPNIARGERLDNGITKVTNWPLGGDATITPIPAAGLDLTTIFTKSAYSQHLQTPEVDDAESAEVLDDATENAIKADQPVIIINNNISTEDIMTDQNDDRVNVLDEKVDALTENLKTLSDGMSKAMDLMVENSKVNAHLKDTGYISPDSEGNERSDKKSFGDWLICVKNGNRSRLKSVYKVMSEGSGTAGGYTVPQEFHNQLLQMSGAAGQLRPLCSQMNVISNAGSIPVLDQTFTPTAGGGNSALAGGIVSAAHAEGGTLTAVDAAFELVSYTIFKMGNRTVVSNELMADSAVSGGLDKLLSTLFGISIASQEDYQILRGTGAGQMTGILTSPATIAVTTATNDAFALADAMNMLAQWKPFMPDGSVQHTWIMHRGILPDLSANFQAGTAGMDFVQPREGVPMSLLGIPIRFSEHMPNPNTDDVILADMSAYIIWDREPLKISFSEHAAFNTDQIAWRWTKRLDGSPWLSTTFTEASPVAYTTSPFLYHND